MGLHFLGVFRIEFLFGRRHPGRAQRRVIWVGTLGGWIRFWLDACNRSCAGGHFCCFAGSEDTVAKGGRISGGCTSMGLGILFILAALFARPIHGGWQFKRPLRASKVVMGGMWVVTGVLVSTNRCSCFSFWMLEMFPGPWTIGIGSERQPVQEPRRNGCQN